MTAADGSGSVPVATLTSTDRVLDDFAAEVGDVGPVAIEGCRTRWQLGGPPAEGTRFLTAPTGIVDYKPDEMTVTVRAGTLVSELHAALAERGQRTALVDRSGTVGGALVVGENDVRALGRGLIRTSVLQVRYVSAEGRIISSGGPTVKNVSGFDLPRLMVGSLGTLGLLAEVIIRTNPIPATSRWLTASGVDPQPVYDALLAPGAVLWDGTNTWVELEGHRVDVDAEHRKLAPIGTFTEVPTAGDGLPMPLPDHRWSMTPAEVLELGQQPTNPDHGFPEAEAGPGSDPGPFVAAVGLGLVFGHNRQPARKVVPEIEVVAARLKENFDPAGRLNPGRDPGRK
ncbi:MAG: FAD-binding protein [Acidimicrobiales bacterium]